MNLGIAFIAFAGLSVFISNVETCPVWEGPSSLIKDLVSYMKLKVRKTTPCGQKAASLTVSFLVDFVPNLKALLISSMTVNTHNYFYLIFYFPSTSFEPIVNMYLCSY